MPNHIWLDSSAKEENPTIIIGKTILLKIIENEKTQSLLKDPVVKKFVNIKNLSHETTRQLISNLIEEEAKFSAPNFVKKLMAQKDALEALAKSIEPIEKLFEPIKNTQLFKSLQDITPKDEITEGLMKNKKISQDFMFRVTGKIDENIVNDYEKRMLTLNKKLKKNSGVSLITTSTLFLCPKCNIVLATHEFTNNHCLICDSDYGEEQLKRIPIFRVPDKIKKVWSSNLWFESYTAGLLRKLGFKTWTGIHVMGASGILHEIDVLAIKDGSLIVCECKTGNISRQNVFNFITKANDLKAHVSILALIGELPEPHTRQFVRRNPAIIRLEKMGKMEETDILTDIENRLRLKT